MFNFPEISIFFKIFLTGCIVSLIVPRTALGQNDFPFEREAASEFMTLPGIDRQVTGQFPNKRGFTGIPNIDKLIFDENRDSVPFIDVDGITNDGLNLPWSLPRRNRVGSRLSNINRGRLLREKRNRLIRRPFRSNMNNNIRNYSANPKFEGKSLTKNFEERLGSTRICYPIISNVLKHLEHIDGLTHELKYELNTFLMETPKARLGSISNCYPFVSDIVRQLKHIDEDVHKVTYKLSNFLRESQSSAEVVEYK